MSYYNVIFYYVANLDKMTNGGLPYLANYTGCSTDTLHF